METLRIAAIQWQFRHHQSSRQWWQELEWQVRIAHRDYRADIIILPEYLYADHPGAWPAHDAVCATLREFAVTYSACIIGGSLPFQAENGLRNRCWIAEPEGEIHHQDKIHITPWERETWGMMGGDNLLVLEILGTKVGVALCYDVEFPEQIRALAERGIEVLCVPYCTDDENGHHRVTRCAMARAIENSIFVATAGCVGTVRGRAGFAHHFARSVIATPCDIGYPRGGIAARAVAQQAQCLVTEISLCQLRTTRLSGTVQPLANLRRDLFGLR